MNKIKIALQYLYGRPELVFVMIALPFGVFSAAVVPQMSVTDEDSHLLRSYQVSRGEAVCHKASEYPDSIVKKSMSSHEGSREYTMDFSDTVDESEQRRYSCSSAAGYAPVAYVPQALGVAISRVVSPSTAAMVLFARITNLLIYILAIYWIIKKVRVGKYVFFVVALIPQMIHIAASLSADMANNIAAMAIVAITLNLFVQSTRISKKQIIAIIVLAILAALLKKNLILLFLPLIFLPSHLFVTNTIKSIPFNIQKWSLAVTSILAFMAAYLVWTKIGIAPVQSAVLPYNPIADHPNLFLNLLFHTYMSDYGDLVLRGVFGDFSSFLYHFPTILIVLQMSILVVVLLHTTPRTSRILANNKWLVLSMTLTFVLSVFAITYGLYTEWGLKRGISQYADGVQGRYFTALIVLLIPLFAWLSKYVTVRFRSERMLFAVVSLSQLILLAFYVFYTIKTLLGK